MHGFPFIRFGNTGEGMGQYVYIEDTQGANDTILGGESNSCLVAAEESSVGGHVTDFHHAGEVRLSSWHLNQSC